MRGRVGDYASDRVFDGVRPISPARLAKLRASYARGMRSWLAILTAVLFGFIAGFFYLLWLVDLRARAEEHIHPTETITGATAKFYETWKRPDQPTISCCNLMDCYSTSIRMTRTGKLQALHRESGDYIDVPPEKIEQNRDSPDGRNHLCASKHKMVFCFVSGAGG